MYCMGLLYEVVIIIKILLFRNKAIDILALQNDRNGVNTGQKSDSIDYWEFNIPKYSKLILNWLHRGAMDRLRLQLNSSFGSIGSKYELQIWINGPFHIILDIVSGGSLFHDNNFFYYKLDYKLYVGLSSGPELQGLEIHIFFCQRFFSFKQIETDS